MKRNCFVEWVEWARIRAIILICGQKYNVVLVHEMSPYLRHLATASPIALSPTVTEQREAWPPAPGTVEMVTVGQPGTTGPSCLGVPKPLSSPAANLPCVDASVQHILVPRVLCASCLTVGTAGLVWQTMAPNYAGTKMTSFGTLERMASDSGAQDTDNEIAGLIPAHRPDDSSKVATGVFEAACHLYWPRTKQSNE